jgi:hypothetical protein
VKPKPEIDGSRFPRSDFFFHSGWNGGHGYWPSDGGQQFSGYNLGREYLIESARERAKEMAVFAIILAAAAWPVIYMIVTVVQVLHKVRP